MQLQSFLFLTHLNLRLKRRLEQDKLCSAVAHVRDSSLSSSLSILKDWFAKDEPSQSWDSDQVMTVALHR